MNKCIIKKINSGFAEISCKDDKSSRIFIGRMNRYFNRKFNIMTDYNREDEDSGWSIIEENGNIKMYMNYSIVHLDEDEMLNLNRDLFG